jgi:hypothetical protein
MQLDMSSGHCFTTEKTQSIHVTKVCMRNEKVVNTWITYHSQLPTKIPCRLNKKCFSTTGLDAK